VIAPCHPTVGVYVHVPFCERVCPYCDFAVVAARPLEAALERRYRDAVLAELEARAPAFGPRRLASVYLGGGTPSLLHPETVALWLEAIGKAFPPLAHDEPEAPVEVTLEVNPSTVERERLPGFRAAGVGRLSVGVQSFDDRMLKRLGRAHRAEEAHRTLRAARRAGFDNVSVDLIFAGPDATAEQLEADLDALLDFAPEHVSLYELTVEEGTPFALAAARGQLARPDEGAVVAMMQRIEERLGAAGLVRYEIASYARPGRESRHNRRYWQRRPVLGLGMGAWSSDPAGPGAPHGTRRSNPTHVPTYLSQAAVGTAAEVERLSPRTALGEAIFLGLRQVAAGVRAAAIAAEFGGTPRDFFAPQIDALVAAGLLAEEPETGDLRLTARGQMLSDSVFERFV